MIAPNSCINECLGGTQAIWFDEYDDSGAGQGYLGFPKGEITKLYTVFECHDDESAAIRSFA